MHILASIISAALLVVENNLWVTEEEKGKLPGAPKLFKGRERGESYIIEL